MKDKKSDLKKEMNSLSRAMKKWIKEESMEPQHKKSLGNYSKSAEYKNLKKRFRKVYGELKGIGGY